MCVHVCVHVCHRLCLQVWDTGRLKTSQIISFQTSKGDGIDENHQQAPLANSVTVRKRPGAKTEGGG